LPLIFLSGNLKLTPICCLSMKLMVIISNFPDYGGGGDQV
jgi:hypothetical protein